MMKIHSALCRNRPGASLVIVAVSLIAMLAVMALAIDMGMMYSARNEAQRVADAAALAGASAYQDIALADVVPEARKRAKDYISGNTVMNTQADTSLATINVTPANFRVEVIVRRRQINTWFARIVGIDTVAVAARAVAEAVFSGGARCVRPWAVQDIWHEDDGSTYGREAREGDKFSAGADGDRYVPVPTTNLLEPSATGYGSVQHTDRDFGRQITFKAQTPAKNPNSDSWEIAQPGPAEFLIWDMPDDPSQEECIKGGGKGGYANDICACNNNLIEVDKEYPLEFGNVVGPGFKGVDELMKLDPNAKWTGDSQTGRVTGSVAGADNWRASPRIVPVALMAPLGPPPGQNWNPSALRTVKFTSIALFFVEGYDEGKGQAQPSITGRFLYYAQGEPGETAGPTMLHLRLVH